MKRLFILCVFLILCVFGYSQLKMSVGLYGGMEINYYNTVNFTDVNEYATSSVTDFDLLFGAFFDIKYLRIMLEFNGAQSGVINLKQVSGGATVSDVKSNSTEDYAKYYINITLLAKYPFEFGFFHLWPAIGLKISSLYSGDLNGDGVSEDMRNYDYNDFYFVLALGMDFYIGDDFFIEILGTACGNFTPIWVKDYTPASTESFLQVVFNAQLGIGWRF